MSVVQFIQKHGTETTRDDHPNAPHETAIMDAELVFPLNVWLQLCIALVSLKPASLEIVPISCSFASDVANRNRGHIHVLHGHDRVSRYWYQCRRIGYREAAKRVGLWYTQARPVEDLVFVCCQNQCPALHAMRHHLRNCPLLPKQAEQRSVVSYYEERTTPQVFVELCQTQYDGQPFFVNLSVVLLCL